LTTIARPEMLRVVVSVRSMSYVLGVAEPHESQSVVVLPTVAARDAGARDPRVNRSLARCDCC
jgi:hypothetical protein